MAPQDRFHSGSGEPRLLLVVGCPRSGTRTLSRRLIKSKVRCDHERVGRHGTVSSYFTVNDYWYQGPHGTDRRSNYAFEQVWHLIRDPLKTISSIDDNMPVTWWHWQEKHTGVSMDEPKIVRAAKFWDIWTQKSAEISQFTIRLEDVEARWPEIIDRLNVPLVELGDVHAHKRANPITPYTWDDLKSASVPLYDSIRSAAERYGYV